MGLFTKTELGTPDDGALPRLSTGQITAVLDSWEARYMVDDEGDPGGYWDGHLFFFMRAGEAEDVLTVRGRWMRDLAVEHLDTVTRLLNDWHTTRIWPKAYVQVEDGRLGIYGDLSTSLAHGATQPQVDDLMGCGLSTTLQLFGFLDEHFPEAAAAAQAEDDDAAADDVAGEAQDARDAARERTAGDR